jgi:fused signal recognition particle receptor
VGVNGNGKTTSVAKLCNKLLGEKKKVILAAADTFRAGAQEQLAIWAERLGVDLVSGAYKSDPAACAYDAFQAACARGADFLIIDTAGRLENKTHLMRELEKIKKSLQKIRPDTPQETLLVLDATVGQNGLENAKTFSTYTPLTGLILTKMDGTAKGGGALVIQKELGIPIKFIGTGEGVDDFLSFDAKAFAHSLFFDE